MSEEKPNLLWEWFGHDPELYEKVLENLNKPFRPVAFYHGPMDFFTILTKDCATVVHPLKDNLIFDLLCDYDGNVVGIQVNSFMAMKLMSPELIAALDIYNLERP